MRIFLVASMVLILISCARLDEEGEFFYVGFSENAVLERLSEIAGVEIVDTVEELKIAKISVSDPSIFGKIRDIDGVDFVEKPRSFTIPTFERHTERDMVEDQWGLLKIFDTDGDGSPNFEVWNLTDGSLVHVAIFDTPVDGSHPDLAGRVGWGYDPKNDREIPPGTDYQDPDFSLDDHGTHVSGIIASLRNDFGTTGVAPGVVINPVVVFKPFFFVGEEYYAKGVVWAVRRGARVFSNSWGGGGYSYTIKRAIDYALRNGVVVIFSAGNSYSDRTRYPASYPGVIAVGASTVRDEKADFSNFGRSMSVLAPGDYVLSTVPGGGYEFWSGTSMAAPHVAGIAALILSLHPDLRPSQVRKMIEMSAVDLYEPGFDELSGYGRVSASAVLMDPPPPGVDFEVVALDSSGNPISALYVNLVSDRSYYAKTDLNGVADFYEIDGGGYSLKIGGPDWLDPMSDVSRPEEGVRFSTDITLSQNSSITVTLKSSLSITTDPPSTVSVFRDGTFLHEEFGSWTLPEDHEPGSYSFAVEGTCTVEFMLNGNRMEFHTTPDSSWLCDEFGCEWRIF